MYIVVGVAVGYEQLWAPFGKQKQLKWPTAHERDMLTPNPCLMWLQQDWYLINPPAPCIS